jgi:para-aminobenzoate synthetase
MDEVEGRLESLPGVEAPVLPSGSVAFSLGRSREGYREDIEACKRWLRAGDSYEICLTNRITAETDAEPLDLYRALRRANPAPFGAYLRFGELAVLSSSPERFLAVDRDRWAESRPIKGTARRSAEPAEDARLAAALAGGEKFRAENVTIVDLMRNDLGRVCEVGSVSVPELMGVESYETVHQLVSSVRGRLRHGLGAADAVRACFPPGSMTGAPKKRTVEILDELEGAARGVYSGAIGWLGLGGACDLSVAIRTIVLDRGRATIGAGGAIVVDSDPDLEIEEMLLTAATAAAALDPEAAVSFAPAGAPGDLSGAAP